MVRRSSAAAGFEPVAGPIAGASTQDFDGFRHLVSTSFVPLKVTSDRAAGFRGRIRSREVDTIHVAEVSAGPHVVERTPKLIARADRRYYKLSVQLAGTGLLLQDNREAVLRPGDLALYATQRPYSLVFDEEFRSIVVMFPQHLIDIPAEMLGQLTAVRLSGHQGVAGMIVPFLARLGDNLEHLGGATGARLAHGALDLVTTLYASELDLTASAADPHRALMRRIRGYIDANLGADDLGPASIAAAHYISTRQLHDIFREHGTTVAGWIRSCRLQRCRRDLLDPVQAHRPIAAIAAKWGFPDAAHFSRLFKAHYGHSPSQVRAHTAA